MLSDTARDDEILGFVDLWADDLARGDYSAALARMAHDPLFQWSPDHLRKVIAGYGTLEPHPSGVTFVVTSRSEARGQQGHRHVDRSETCPAGAVALVWYDLPINGDWSDLTATLRIEPGRSGLRMILEEVHAF